MSDQPPSAIHTTPAAQLAARGVGRPKSISPEERLRRQASAANARQVKLSKGVRRAEVVIEPTVMPVAGIKRKIVIPTRTGGFTMSR